MCFTVRPDRAGAHFFFPSRLVCPPKGSHCVCRKEQNILSTAVFDYVGGGRNPAPVWVPPQEDVMHLHGHLWKSLFGKAALATAALSAFLLLPGAPSARANDWDSCNRRAAYVEFRL